MSSGVIDLDEEVEATAPVGESAAVGSRSEAAIELSDTEDEPRPSPNAPTSSAGSKRPAPNGAADAPLELDDDDNDPAAAREEARRREAAREAAACYLCMKDDLTNPHELKECGHQFCRRCLHEYVDRKLRRVLASEVGCPKCAQQMSIIDVQTLSVGHQQQERARSAAGPPPLPAGMPSLPPGVPPHLAALAMLQHGFSRAGAAADANKRARTGGGGGGSSSAPSSSAAPAPVGSRALGSSVATKRLMKELQALRKADASAQGIEVSLPEESDLYTWDAHFFNFERGTPLHSDLQRVPGKRILLRIAFPSQYPSAPPYVRVIRPRFAYRTGHVTIGGSICTEMLTSQGWSSTMTVESVLLGIRANMIAGGARLTPNDRRDYSEAEAREAFERMRREHGWY